MNDNYFGRSACGLALCARVGPHVVPALSRDLARSVRHGPAALAEGRRKARLQKQLEALVAEDLDYHIAVFDSRAAGRAAELAAERKHQGRPVDIRDTFIAGIALAHGATLATRNTRHFDDLPVPVVNPWEAGQTLG